jgi:Na+-driven multidrug efflux pump
MRWNNRAFGKILTQGLPIGLVNVLYPLANLQIQSALNSYGVAAIAGNSASATLENVSNACHGNLSAAIGVFMGQNLGAQKHDRVKRTLFHGLWLSPLTGLVIGLSMYLSGRFWVNLILPGDTEAADFAMVRMGCILAFHFVSGFNGVLSHFLQSFGYAFLSSLNSIVCVLGFRFVWMTWVYPRHENFFMLMVCYLISWLLMLTANFCMSAVVYARYRKGRYKRL